MYVLHKRISTSTTIELRPVEGFTFAHFTHAWELTLDMLNQLGFTIVGCHLSPEHGPSPAYAEFFVVAQPNIHETYIIINQDPAHDRPLPM